MIAHNLHYPIPMNVTMPDNQESSECTKLIRKLRWIGLDMEAKRLEEALRTFAPNERGVVLADPIATD
jgi:hypothetical protein